MISERDVHMLALATEQLIQRGEWMHAQSAIASDVERAMVECMLYNEEIPLLRRAAMAYWAAPVGGGYSVRDYSILPEFVEKYREELKQLLREYGA